MCFSANASFTASALLFLCSMVTFKRAQTKQRMLAAVPLLFAIQQFCEGLVWLGLTQGNYPTWAIYSYLFFVEIVWPLWIPLSVQAVATKQSEKKALTIPLTAGIIVAVVTIISFFTHPPVQVSIEHRHLYYAIILPQWLYLPLSICYIIAIIAPFFIVKKRYFTLMGSALAISYAISMFFFYQHFLSVWCFFAAFISIFMCLILR